MGEVMCGMLACDMCAVLIVSTYLLMLESKMGLYDGYPRWLSSGSIIAGVESPGRLLIGWWQAFETLRPSKPSPSYEQWLCAVMLAAASDLLCSQ